MAAPINTFKAALKARRRQLGLWMALANPNSAELLASVGFDWLVIDLEHAPNDLRSAVAQMQAMAASGVEAVVRPPIGETWIIKQLLDAGCQTLLIPMVESAEQAQEMVRAVHYPPRGVRGVGAGLARASQYGGIADYLRTADEQICLLLQVESRKGLQALDEILAVPDVDGIFIGPADLAADMGHLGDPGAPAVQDAVKDALQRIVKAGKHAGILTSDPALLRVASELGADFIAIGSDVGLLRMAAKAALAGFPGS